MIFWIFSLIFINFSEISTSTDTCGTRKFTAGLIFGGENAVKGQWPWMAPIRNKMRGKYVCGSTLISNKHSLTAAHCIRSVHQSYTIPPAHLFILFGNVDLENPNNWLKKDVTSHKVHPDWSKRWDKATGIFDADIAILTFPQIDFTPNINKICLPNLSDEVYGVEGTIVGFGLVKGGTEAEKIAKFVEIKTVDQETCFLDDPTYVTIASTRTFCAGGELKVPCSGDSGGGFFRKDPITSRFNILGIVSSTILTENQCDDTKYAIFTNILPFLGWINENIDDEVLTTRRPSTTLQPNYRQRGSGSNRWVYNQGRGAHEPNRPNYTNSGRYRGSSCNKKVCNPQNSTNPSNMSLDPTPTLNYSNWSEWSACNATLNQHGYTWRSQDCLSDFCYYGPKKYDIRICVFSYENYAGYNNGVMIGGRARGGRRRFK